jgi:hypothetical protein
MSARLGSFITAGIVLLLVIVGVLVYQTPEGPIEPAAGNNQVRIGKGKMQAERLSGHAWTVNYDRIHTNTDETVVDLDGVHDGIIYRGGKPYLRVQAQHLQVNTLTKDFTASGRIHVERIGKANFHDFESDAGTWTNALQRLYLPHKTVVELEDGKKITVERAGINLATGHIHVEGVQGTM